MATMIFVIAIILTVLGVFITCLNIYIGFIRYSLHQLLHRDKKFQYVSGIPLFGALFLWISALSFWRIGHGAWALAAVLFSIFDTGGLHWFLYSMARQSWRKV